jgi:hypothetical protein
MERAEVPGGVDKRVVLIKRTDRAWLCLGLSAVRHVCQRMNSKHSGRSDYQSLW